LSLWFSVHDPSETATPSLALVLGEIEHKARSMTSDLLRGRYTTAARPEELWSDELERNVRGIVSRLFEEHAFASAFGEPARLACEQIAQRLADENRARARKASATLKKGVRGERLADKFLPRYVEHRMEDPTNNFVGVADEIWTDGKHLMPVELKTSPPHSAHIRANRFQAAAYATLIENVMRNSVRTCEVHYVVDGKRDRFAFGSSWKKRIAESTQRARKIASSVSPPRATPSSEICTYCPFQHVCPHSKAPPIDESLDRLIYQSVQQKR
jgi:CRISPR-associated protein Cas4